MADAGTRRRQAPTPAVEDLLQQLRVLGLQGVGGKDKTYAGLAASRSSPSHTGGIWRPAAGPPPDGAPRARQRGQPPSAYFSSRRQDSTPPDLPGQAGHTPPSSWTVDGAASPEPSSYKGHSPLAEEDGILFHMSGVKPSRQPHAATPDAELLHRSRSAPQQQQQQGRHQDPHHDDPRQQQQPSPPGVLRSFSFTQEPSPREQGSTHVPTQRAPPNSRPGSRATPPSAISAGPSSHSPTTAPQPPGGAQASRAASTPNNPTRGSSSGGSSVGSSRRRSSSRMPSTGRAAEGPAAGAPHAGALTPEAAGMPGTGTPDPRPAWSEELLNWMLVDKAELLMQLQRVQRAQQELQREVEQLRERAAADQELVRLQAERWALLDRVQQLSRTEAEASAGVERLRMENDALAGELEQSQEVCREMLAARRAARDALSEMSAQNARLVTAYVERKQEAAALREALRRQERDAERRVRVLEAQLEQTRAQLAEHDQQQHHHQQSQQQHFAEPSALPQPCSPAGSRASQNSRSPPPSPQQAASSPVWGPASSDHPAGGRAAAGSGCASRGGQGSPQHQQAGKENAGAAGNTASGVRADCEAGQASKGQWDRERSELLSLLERLHEQLSAHAGREEEEGEDEDEQYGAAAGATPGAGGSPGTTPYASPSEGEEASPPAAAYDSPEQQHEQAEEAGPGGVDGDGDGEEAAGPAMRRTAANLAASFDQAAMRRSREPVGSQSGDDAPGSTDSFAASPAVAAHRVHATPPPPPPAHLRAAAAARDRDGAPPPSGSFQPCPAPATSRPKSRGSRTPTSSFHARLIPFAAPAPVHQPPGMQEAPGLEEPRAAHVATEPVASAGVVASPGPWARQQGEGKPTGGQVGPFQQAEKQPDATRWCCEQQEEEEEQQAGGRGSRAREQEEQQQLEDVEQRNAELQAEVERLRRLQEEAAQLARWEEQRRRAGAHKQAGNAAFQQRQFEGAVREYTAGLELLQEMAAAAAAAAAAEGAQSAAGPGQGPQAMERTSQVQEERRRLREQDGYLAAVLHCNRAAALQASGRYLDAVADCFRAEEWEPSYLRIYQRRSDAFCALGAYALGIQDLERAVEVGGGHEAQARLAEVQRRAKTQPPMNHYAVLGLDATATPAEVKASYRRLALQFHPDKAGGSAAGTGRRPLRAATCEQIFKLVTEAYSVLADAERRRVHDILALRYKYKRFYGAAG